MRIFVYCLMLAFVLNASASVSVSVNGTSYTIPQTNEKGWGTNVTNWIQAMSLYTLQPSGGAFTLTAEVDTGATYGFKVPYIKTETSNPSTAGVLRLAKTDSVGWRNNANGGNLLLAIDGSDNLTFNGVAIPAATSASFQDSTFTIYDNGDATKKIAFQASGITTGTTRTITMPDFAVDLGNLTVAQGGTGRNTLTNHGVLVGAATSGITQLAAGSAGQVLQSGGASADPAYSTPTYPSVSGTAGKILRADGTNNVYSTNTFPDTASAGTILNAGSANTFSATATPTLGASSSATGKLNLSGTTSGTITIQPQDAAGTYNFNLPITAGSAGTVLTSQGGGSTAMTWTSPLTNPMTTTGDIIYSSSGSTAARLAISGTNNRQTLFNNAGVPGWGIAGLFAATRSVTGTDSAVLASDDVLILSGASFTETLPNAAGAGVAGKIFILVHNGTSLSQKYTLATGGGTICGIASGSYVLTTNLEKLAVISDGTNYQCIYHSAETTSAAYTATINNWTVTNQNLTWERHGHMMHILGSFVYSASAVALGSVALPTGAVLDTTGLTSTTTGQESPVVGRMLSGFSGNAAGGSALIALGTSTSLIYGGLPLSGTGPNTPQNASAGNCGSSSHTCSIEVYVPISDWQP